MPHSNFYEMYLVHGGRLSRAWIKRADPGVLAAIRVARHYRMAFLHQHTWRSSRMDIGELRPGTLNLVETHAQSNNL